MITLFGCSESAKHSVREYPETRKDLTVVDNYFGTDVADPYRWLENDTTAETAQWVEAQRAVTEDYLSQIPFREDIKKRMTELVNYERYSLPSKRFNRYLYSKNDGLQNQNVIYIQNSLDEEPSVLLD
ncbi:MAG: S9 family peptidase, partial [Bacteroidales bacterium]|nr:S9 family peptidase [Bacteroidales bacterium]